MTGESSSCVSEAAESRGDLLVQRRRVREGVVGACKKSCTALQRHTRTLGTQLQLPGGERLPQRLRHQPRSSPRLGRPTRPAVGGEGDAQGSAGGFSGCCCQLRRALQLLPAAGARLSLPSKRCLGAGLLLATAGAMVSKRRVPHVSFRGLGELRALREPLWGADAFSPCSHAASKACGGICLLQIASN